MSLHPLARRSWCVRTALALPMLLATCALPAAPRSDAAACAGSAAMAFELSIASGGVRGSSDDPIVVRAHADGCVAIRRPWFLREAGEFELRLDETEWHALQRQVDIDALRAVSQRALDRWSMDRKRADASPGAIVFHNPDPDLYTLRWRDHGELRRLVAPDLLEASASSPKSAPQASLAAAVRALQALASSSTRRTGAENVP